jgi:hypothetical protein
VFSFFPAESNDGTLSSPSADLSTTQPPTNAVASLTAQSKPSAVSEQQTQASRIESKQTQHGFTTPPTQLPEGFVVVK